MGSQTQDCYVLGQVYFQADDTSDFSVSEAKQVMLLLACQPAQQRQPDHQPSKCMQVVRAVLLHLAQLHDCQLTLGGQPTIDLLDLLKLANGGWTARLRPSRHQRSLTAFVSAGRTAYSMQLQGSPLLLHAVRASAARSC